MDNQETTEKKKSVKKQLFETVYARLDSALAEYKELFGEKKFSGYLKRNSKDLVDEIGKEIKRAKERKRKLSKKSAKKEKKKAN